MINIFGKLYTLLRRPNQQNNTPEDVGNTQEEENAATDDASGRGLTDSWIHVRTDPEPGSLESSGTDLDAVQREQLLQQQQQILTPEDRQDVTPEERGDEASENEVVRNNTMDMEAMSKLVEEMQSAEEKRVNDQVEIETTKKEENTSDVASTSPKLAETTEERSISDNARLEEDEANPAVLIQKEQREEVKQSESHEEVETKEPSSATKECTKKDNVKPNQNKPTQETAGKLEKKGTQSRCRFFFSGRKCFKGSRCQYSHDLQEKNEPTEISLREEDFPSYNDFVTESTAVGINIQPKDLIYKLGYQKCPFEALEVVMKGQHKLAVSKQRWHWVSQARYYADLLFPKAWIDENLPTKDGPKKSKSRDKPKQKKSKYNVNEQYEGRRGMCQDVRLLENPNLPCISSNLGNKEKKKEATPSQVAAGNANVEVFVTDYTNGIINKAVRQAVEETHDTDKVLRGAIREAMDEGLSESLIMEVMDDVTNIRGTPQSGTPSKRGKVNKPDVRRTPRQRPDELAIGFNYMSEELVKHSPKTVDGGIICMDTLPPSKERPEQLAFGFNFHADQLVQDSPKSETGEALIPGVVLTPGRKTRDQLAIGFNYHSNLIVKESPKSLDTENKPKKRKGKKKKLYQEKDVNENNFPKECQIDHTGDGSFNSKRANKDEERFAFGFSKNAEILAHSDEMVAKVLGEVDGNVSSQHTENLDVSLEEDRNASELDDSFVPTMVPSMLPAGSVW